MRSLKKLLSWAENNRQTTTMMNALPLAAVWKHFADQIRYEIDNMSQDENEDQVLKRLLRWAEENKKLANSNSSLETYTVAISVAWGQAVSAIRDEL
jgi:hypothetical protein